MNALEIIRAWKDAAFRASLSPDQLAALPPNPAGMVELSESDLDGVVGGAKRTSTAPGSGCGTGTGTHTGTGTGTRTRTRTGTIRR
jgi:mersacidin/lichenicidin family type 2 lantibiotic